LRSAESIARGYGSGCYKVISDELHAGMQSLMSMCLEMNTQAHRASVLPDIIIKHKKQDPTLEQINFMDELFVGESCI
jgi:hypothetical protein